MKKYKVTAEIVHNHFLDGAMVFTYENHSTLDIGEIMTGIMGYDNPDEYDNIFAVEFKGKEYSY